MPSSFRVEGEGPQLWQLLSSWFSHCSDSVSRVVPLAHFTHEGQVEIEKVWIVGVTLRWRD